MSVVQKSNALHFIETGDGIVLAIDIYVESVSSPEY